MMSFHPAVQIGIHRLENIADPLDFMISSIDNGYFVNLGWNEYYVPYRIAYQKYSNCHDVLVTGYDDNEEILYILGYDEKMQFKETKISYENARMAMIGDDEIRLYKAQENFKYQLNIDLVVNSITD